MDRATAEKFFKRAKLSARKFGFHDEAEDLAQDVLLAFVKNPETKQTVDQACVDAIRARYGRISGSHDDGMSIRKRGKRLHVSLDKAKAVPASTGFVPAGFRPLDEDTLRVLKRAAEDPVERACFILVFGWGLSLGEVGICFGVSESRISQRISAVEARIHQALAREEQRQVEGVLPDVDSEAWCEREAQRGLAEVLPIEGYGLDEEAGFGMEEGEPGQVGCDHEESIPEWFA